MWFQEQEARTALLRSQSQKRSSQSVEEEATERAVVVCQDKPRHINFFAEIEEGVSEVNGNILFQSLYGN